MEIFKEIEPLKAFLRQQKIATRSLGFVPTMGALHQGHLSLIKASKVENALTICSIYVNPAQFNNLTDLAKYPRALDQDIELLRKTDCDVLFCPDNSTMYSSESLIRFDFGMLDKVMEGRYRPGHFSGVALVVSKLFHIVSPDKAYFGQKDFQQFKVIEKLVQELKFDITLRCMPIERESDGLAMSSRNVRLLAEQRKKAIIFYDSLKETRELLEKGNSMQNVLKVIINKFENSNEVRLEYLELADVSNLSPQENVSDKINAILLIAGYVGEVRLIDNLLL
ncbi:MAG TPA: pantoate--beta-alanine ligase [Cyclobacteriaceae bacterium]|nr:pantoate--beta-alanine ligase [Cyclobacteriaceae bacterium]